MGDVPRCDFHVGICVIHLCADALESEWQEVGVGIDLQGGVSRKSEICRRSGKTSRYRFAECPTCRLKWLVVVKL